MFAARGPKSGIASSSLWVSFLCGEKQKSVHRVCVCVLITAQSDDTLWKTERHLAAVVGRGSGPCNREEKQGSRVRTAPAPKRMDPTGDV